jgi:hypothetical protein
MSRLKVEEIRDAEAAGWEEFGVGISDWPRARVLDYLAYTQ